MPLLLALALLSATPTQAIQKRFAQAGDLEEAGNFHDVQLNSVLPAVGAQTRSVRFIHRSEQEDPERNPYAMKHELVKVVVSYFVAASAEIRTEYLFDARGELVFHFAREGGVDGFRATRIYFDGGSPYRVLVDTGDSDAPERKTFTTLTADQKKRAKSLRKWARRYSKAFEALVAVEAAQ
ncbi:MAG: hypothetical protein AAF658_19090 [Myxococcota bacterium]